MQKPLSNKNQKEQTFIINNKWWPMNKMVCEILLSCLWHFYIIHFSYVYNPNAIKKFIFLCPTKGLKLNGEIFRSVYEYLRTLKSYESAIANILLQQSRSKYLHTSYLMFELLRLNVAWK